MYLRRFIIVFAFVFVVAGASRGQQRGDVVVLYENDVHCAVDGYPVIAGLRDSLERMGCTVGVVSGGDFAFGGTLGAASKGEYIVRLMNAVGYDAVCVGNHEFDYGMIQLRRLDSLLAAPMLSCNFCNNGSGVSVMKGFVISHYGDKTVAYVGVTTPSTIYTSSPVNFQNAEGEYIYNFSPNNLAENVQVWVNAAHAAHADKVVLLTHMGDKDGQPTSVSLVEKLSGVDVVIDAHDHREIERNVLKDKDKNNVLMTSTGTHFAKIGMLVIPADGGDVYTRLLSVDTFLAHNCVSRQVEDTLNVIRMTHRALGNRKVAECQQDMIANTSDGMRICRLRETNLGDLVADAYRTVLGADIGWVNGGGLRANINAGKVTYNDLFAVQPYANELCVVEVSGQEILDALETAVRALPKAEGCFPQVSGLSFIVDTSGRSWVQLDGNGKFRAVRGTRRVSDVRVQKGNSWVRLKPNKRYTIASSKYLLLNSGDALSFPTGKVIPTDPVTDTEVLEEYLTRYLGGTIGSSYAYPQQRLIYKRPRK